MWTLNRKITSNSRRQKSSHIRMNVFLCFISSIGLDIRFQCFLDEEIVNTQIKRKSVQSTGKILPWIEVLEECLQIHDYQNRILGQLFDVNLCDVRRVYAHPTKNRFIYWTIYRRRTRMVNSAFALRGKKNKSHRPACKTSNCTEISWRPTAVDVRYVKVQLKQ